MSLVFLKKENGRIIGYDDKLTQSNSIAYQNNTTKIKLFPNEDKSKNIIIGCTGFAFVSRIIFSNFEKFFDVNLISGDVNNDSQLIVDSLNKLFLEFISDEETLKDDIQSSCVMSIGSNLYLIELDKRYKKLIRADNLSNVAFIGYGGSEMEALSKANVPMDKAFEVIHEMYPSYVSKEFDAVEYEYE